ncbi:MAG: DMT family transporter [Deltaproteobacteria bacterium]|nr:DMT family transporter [Deltaproteobacteria bacterium]
MSPLAAGELRGVLLRAWTGVLCISFSAIFVRLSEVPAVQSAFWRTGYAAIFLAIVALARRERLADLFFPGTLVAGMLLGADFLAWHGSIVRIGAGLATVLPNLQLVGVGILGIFVFRERPRLLFWLGVPVVFAGVWLLGVVGRPVAQGASVPLGVLLGVVTALFYTAYLLTLRWARLRRPALSTLAVVASLTFGAALVTGIGAVVDGVAAVPEGLEANLWLLCLALGSHVGGWLLLASSIHRIPAALTSVTLLLQPVLSILWGALLLAEPIGWSQIAGAAIVLSGVAVAHQGAARPAPAGGE